MIEETVEYVGEDRIDDIAIDAFSHMGFTGRLPDALVETYQRFKKWKDELHPGRVSPEGFAMCVMFYMSETASDRPVQVFVDDPAIPANTAATTLSDADPDPFYAEKELDDFFVPEKVVINPFDEVKAE